MCNSILLLFYHSYVRSEVLAGFVNGLFLLFIAFFIFSEAVEVSMRVFSFSIYIYVNDRKELERNVLKSS